jgi:hypothetical protein
MPFLHGDEAGALGDGVGLAFEDFAAGEGFGRAIAGGLVEAVGFWGWFEDGFDGAALGVLEWEGADGGGELEEER